jgi:glucosamine-6-phosphate deaminase
VALDPTVFPDADAMGEALALEIASGIEQALSEGRRYVLGCPGGRSPLSTYRALATMVKQSQLDLSHLVLALMDEYVVEIDGQFRAVGSDAHYSVARFAGKEIVGPLNAGAASGGGVGSDRVWGPDPSDPASYDQRLAAAGGIDLFILASGDSDGHVAFNPPGSAPDTRTRIVALPDSTRRDNLSTFPQFASLEEVPRFGVSVGIATIMSLSHRAVLVAPGASKRTAVARVAASDGYDPTWPATVVCACPRPSLFADLAAVDALSESASR